MDNKSLRLHKIILAIEIGIVSLIIVLKLVYYISKFQDGFFESVLDFVIWTTVSVFISLIPISILVILNVSEISAFPVFVPYLPMADMKVFASQSLCYTACSASCASLRSNDFFQKSLPDMRVCGLLALFF